jgi:hypothetical protein
MIVARLSEPILKLGKAVIEANTKPLTQSLRDLIVYRLDEMAL